MIKLFKLVILFCVICIVISCSKSDTGGKKDNFATSKQSIIDLYDSEYLGSATSNINWTGNISSCNAGTISTDAQEKTLQRINYFRKMAGLADDITFDVAKNEECQQAALVMHANGSLNHHPPTNWTCYSQAAYDGASSSNIASGSVCSNAINAYMRDNGSNNIAVGHRRWILYSKAKVMGHGATSSYDALGVIGSFANPDTLPEFIAWPPKGYVPAPLVYARWSFSIPGASFSNATISMVDNSGSPVNVSVIFTDNKKSSSENLKLGSYGDNAIIWEPESLELGLDDYSYHVKIENVLLGGETKTYEYDVVVIQVL